MGMWCRVCGLGTSWLALLMCDLLVCFIVMHGIDGFVVVVVVVLIVV